MSYKYLIFLLLLISCQDRQEIRNSSSGFDELSNGPHYENITYLNFQNENLVEGHKEEIEQLSTTYNLDIACVNYMLIDCKGLYGLKHNIIKKQIDIFVLLQS